MYKLYWAPGSAAMAPHAMLEDIGAPFELIKVDLDAGQQHDPNYLKLNPHARVPTLIYDGGKVMYESAAISLFLTERHPEARLAPPPGDPDRGPFLQWMAHLTNTVQEALMHYWRPNFYIDDAARQAEFKQAGERRTGKHFAFIDQQLAENGPYLCGSTLYVCDYYLAMLVRWTRTMATPAHANPNVNTLVRAAMARPAYARMLKAEGIEQPV
ncbi:MAG TPA: glutathione S-transferase [Dongiaceae bacterium]|jgi:glutathione S-transferase|nr:glutathione S-transferase [Dongiaceae bacterium]